MEKVAYYLENSGSFMGQYVAYRDVSHYFDDEIQSLVEEMKAKELSDIRVGSLKEFEEAAYNAICKLFNVGSVTECTKENFELIFKNFTLKEMTSRGLSITFRDKDELCFGLHTYCIKIGNRYYTTIAKSGTKHLDLIALCKCKLKNKSVKKLAC